MVAMVATPPLVLAAMAVPAVQTLVRRAEAMEARSLLASIAAAELTFKRDHKTFIACKPSAGAPPRGTTALFDDSKPGWAELDFRVEGPVRYRYEVVLDGDSFKAIATGDLDGDGKPSRFEIDGRTLDVTVQDELE